MWVIGDVHGKIDAYLATLENRVPAGEQTIQLGDMGIGFEGVHLPKLERRSRFIRGNHDNPAPCRAHPNYLGDYGYLPEEDIFYIGGAFSIDRESRVEGVSWWRDEELSYTELARAIEAYHKSRPRVVVSHECPRAVSELLLSMLNGGLGHGMYQTYPDYYGRKLGCVRSRTACALQVMLEHWEPEHWFFGHYHVTKTLYVANDSGSGFRKTAFHCVGELDCQEVPPPKILATEEEIAWPIRRVCAR